MTIDPPFKGALQCDECDKWFTAQWLPIHKCEPLSSNQEVFCVLYGGHSGTNAVPCGCAAGECKLLPKDNKVTTSEQMVPSSNEIADEAGYWRELWQKTANGLLGAQAEIEELRRMRFHGESVIADLKAERDRLVSRNAQLEEESLKRDTELRMERDTNTEHCKARAALEHDLERHIAIASEHATENARLSLSLEGAEIAANAFAQELNEMAAERDKLSVDIEKYRANETRLRAALERIAAMPADAWHDSRMRQIAREALAGVDNPPKSSPVGG